MSGFWTRARAAFKHAYIEEKHSVSTLQWPIKVCGHLIHNQKHQIKRDLIEINYRVHIFQAKCFTKQCFYNKLAPLIKIITRSILNSVDKVNLYQAGTLFLKKVTVPAFLQHCMNHPLPTNGSF